MVYLNYERSIDDLNGKRMKIEQVNYDELIQKFKDIIERLDVLEPSQLLTMANLLNEARLNIWPFDNEIGTLIKDEADKLRNFANFDDADPVQYFISGNAMLRKGIEDFIVKLEISN
jgi:hypothetical protein